MPETIFPRIPGVKKAPPWMPHAGNGDPDSFAVRYHERMAEFRAMGRSQLRDTVEKLRMQVRNDGRLYVTKHRAWTKAAEDVYFSRFLKGDPKEPAFV